MLKKLFNSFIQSEYQQEKEDKNYIHLDVHVFELYDLFTIKQYAENEILLQVKEKRIIGIYGERLHIEQMELNYIRINGEIDGVQFHSIHYRGKE